MANADDWSDFFAPASEYTGPPLTAAMVVAAERALGYTLPAPYLQLLRVRNGGRPRRQCHPTGGAHWSDDHVRVVAVFGLGGNWGIDSDRFGTRHLIAQAGLPEIGVVVGMTAAGGHDAVMLDYSGCGPGGEPAVVLADPEDGVTPLAADFGAFARGLVDCRPYDEARQRALDEHRRRHPR